MANLVKKEQSSVSASKKDAIMDYLEDYISTNQRFPTANEMAKANNLSENAAKKELQYFRSNKEVKEIGKRLNHLVVTKLFEDIMNDEKRTVNHVREWFDRHSYNKEEAPKAGDARGSGVTVEINIVGLPKRDYQIDAEEAEVIE